MTFSKHIIAWLTAAALLAGCQHGVPQVTEPEAENPAGQEQEQVTEPESTTPSRVDIYPNFQSQFVPSRTLRVWVPAGYSDKRRYDVLYMHDGTMLFDASITWNHLEWGVDEAMDTLVNKGLIRPTIVVGIDNRTETFDRVSEYCPDDVAALLPEGKKLYNGLGTPKGNDYLRFLIEEVKPFVDSVYSTYTDREHTWVMGSSCGGLISSYALCKYPQVFAGAACMSTHCTLAADPAHPDQDAVDAYRNYLQAHIPANSAKLYFDRGDKTLDANYEAAQNAINDMLRQQGWDDAHFMYCFFPGHAHEESSWRTRLDVPLRFLLAE